VRIALDPGEWYGRDIDITILDEEAPAENCVEITAKLLLTVRGDPASTGRDMLFTIRAERGGQIALGR
jgi:hypothetical protein